MILDLEIQQEEDRTGYGDVEETAKNKTVRENWYDVETCDPVRLEASS